MFGFDNFRGIHEAAQELLKGWTDDIQKKWKEEYPSEYLGARPARLDHHRELFGHLFQKEPIAGDDAKRKRLNKAARDLGLDFPTGKKQAPK